ncbi:ORC-CDC6 family AAA ATPase [Bordetella bronchiseptica]|uniref:Uncharacterized protein n=2 Tax=Bordetella bronchiseptica TaxID=518 RepID=A0A0H3LSD3_BORBR|nr:hypothetical protein [Bordetella bronchiseptica]KAK66234.1 hypothetical protein AZ22_0990 [Bordetella bronchiseptica 980-2]KDD54684.1 hypothetical protein L533_1243 [Bordetella bronchiseptica OSU553]AUV49780.1 hypothetical protein AL472_25320 [Bordetella bronchiseptica]KCV52407.1 hypothetical protein L491_1223 [Bordetella bronchiseptica 3E44]KDB88361.1 hypothetical protein AZ27_1236 [Bordetella bronchiseptica D756]
MKPINLAFLRIAKRAERQDDDVLHKTFVDFGSVFTAFSSVDHQVVFGRRGTGKTHLLTVLRQAKRSVGETAIQIDMRNLGSAGGVYADASVPLTQRATRLLVDVLAAIHTNILEQAIEHDEVINLGKIGKPLDEFFDAHSSVKVVGATTLEAMGSTEDSGNAQAKLGVSIGTVSSFFSGEAKTFSESKETIALKKIITGQEIPRVNFGSVGNALRKLVETLPKGRLWILIDEWSEVPLDLQPYLADLIRRAILPIRGATVKIAAIEQRSRLLLPEATIGNIGLELGADVSAAINLDDYMVFDNDEDKAVAFYKALVLKHVQVALEAENISAPNNEAELISQGFTQGNAFDEVVRACEGVPRDAIHILSHAAQRADDDTISVSGVRIAARQWYQGSKDAAVSAHEQARSLLQWIVDKVIKERQTKAFLLEIGTRDALIDFLYDERVLHVLRKGVSAKDEPGKRYQVYGIDYGCYVDLINTARAPQGVLDLGDNEPDIADTVPKTDFRSIRRCILNLPEFYGNPRTL